MRRGFAFPEHIKTEKIIRRRPPGDRHSPMRTAVLFILLVGSFSILLFKLFHLQIIQGSYYRSLSDSNRIRTHVIHAPRGVIFDRNNKPLVFNVPGFRLVEGDKTQLLTNDEALTLIAQKKQKVEVDSLRKYAFPVSFSHVLGYVGQISEEELKQDTQGAYQLTDVVGKSGIEQYYESVLKGVDGKELIEVDASGKKIRSLGKTDPLPGKDITLTMDEKLQSAVFDAMNDVQKGAAIVSTPKGEILAMVSKPSFDTNLFTMGEGYNTGTTSGYQNIESILTDGENQPLLNRVIGGVYPPGSTFKLVTAAAGLEEKLIDNTYTVVDKGILRVGEFSFANWYYTDHGGTDGEVDVIKAISRSNDIFFYKLAELVGVDRLSGTAKNFGIGKTLGIDLSGEEAGILPTREWKEKEIGESWYLGDTYHYGIGQGFLLTTPLHVNAWTQVVANGGALYQPHLVENQSKGAKQIQKDFLSDKTVNLIREGMIRSCKPGGVAFPFFDFAVKNPELQIDGKNILQAEVASKSSEFSDYKHVSVACKTGTAQHGGETTEPHAWITLFAPAYDPEIVVTVLVDSGGQGSSVAGPIAEDIVTKYFEGK